MVASFPGQLKGGGAVVAPCDQPSLCVQPAGGKDCLLQPDFNKGCDRCAKWRWKTLEKVTADLLRLEAAVRAAVASIGSADALKTRDGKFGVFFATVQDSAFWERTRWVNQILQPLKKFAAWIRGCECCEDQRIHKKTVVCDRQGCRASSLGQQLETTFGLTARFEDSYAG